MKFKVPKKTNFKSIVLFTVELSFKQKQNTEIFRLTGMKNIYLSYFFSEK